MNSYRQSASKNPCTVIKSQTFSGFIAVTCAAVRKLPVNSLSSVFLRSAFFVAIKDTYESIFKLLFFSMEFQKLEF